MVNIFLETIYKDFPSTTGHDIEWININIVPPQLGSQFLETDKYTSKFASLYTTTPLTRATEENTVCDVKWYQQDMVEIRTQAEEASLKNNI